MTDQPRDCFATGDFSDLHRAGYRYICLSECNRRECCMPGSRLFALPGEWERNARCAKCCRREMATKRD